MLVLFTDKLSRREIPERSAFTLTGKVYDNGDDPWVLSAPTTIDYRIDGPGGEIKAWTTVTPASTFNITVTATENAITSSSRAIEQRLLTVRINNGLSTQAQGAYTWRLANLPGQ